MSDQPQSLHEQIKEFAAYARTHPFSKNLEGAERLCKSIERALAEQHAAVIEAAASRFDQYLCSCGLNVAGKPKTEHEKACPKYTAGIIYSLTPADVAEADRQRIGRVKAEARMEQMQTVLAEHRRLNKNQSPTQFVLWMDAEIGRLMELTRLAQAEGLKEPEK